jgi:hypothetical protein
MLHRNAAPQGHHLSAPGLHVTIATVPRGGLSVVEEVRLVKAALLYADDVTICSANVAMLHSIGTLLDEPPAKRARNLIEIASVLLEPKARQTIEFALSQPRRVRRTLPGIAKLEKTMSTLAVDAEEIIRTTRRDAAMDELQGAIDAGLVAIDNLGLEPVSLVQDCILLASGKRPSKLLDRGTAEALFDRIGSIAAAGAGTYPLFNPGASDVLDTMIREGIVASPAPLPAGQAGLGAHFVAYLPAFPDARVDEIVDVRRGLAKPLIGFRGAVAEMASELEAAAWEPGFTDEADALYRRYVAPALLELEETARNQRAFDLTVNAATSMAPWTAGGAVLGLALAGATTIPDIAAAAFSIGAPTAAMVAGVLESQKERMRLNRVADNNRFVFLYRADRALDRHPA